MDNLQPVVQQELSSKLRKWKSDSFEQDSSSNPLEDEATLNYYKDQCHNFEEIIVKKESLIDILEKEQCCMKKENKILKEELDKQKKDKDSAVMKYASVERKLIEKSNKLEAALSKLEKQKKEFDSHVARIRNLETEKSQLQNLVDQKIINIKKIQNDIDRLKEDFTNIETKNKWNVTKLKQEMESRAALDTEADKLKRDNKQLIEKIDQLTAKMKEEHKDDSIADPVTTQEYKELEAKFIILQYDDKSKSAKISTLENEVSELQQSLLKTENELQELRSTINDAEEKYTAEITKLNQQIDEFTEVEQKKKPIDAAVDPIEELYYYEEDIDKFKLQLADALNTNSEMTSQFTDLQNRLAMKTNMLTSFELDIDCLKNKLSEVTARNKELESNKTEMDAVRKQELDAVLKVCQKYIKLYETIANKHADAKGDLEALQKKHETTVKELKRKIDELKRRAETKMSENCNLSRLVEEEDDGNLLTPSKKDLIARIIKLQTFAAEQTDKINFLENHAVSLMYEIQKLNKKQYTSFY